MISQEDQPSSRDYIRLVVIVLAGLALVLFIFLGL